MDVDIYKKTVTINDQSNNIFEKISYYLFDIMFKNCHEKNESLQFFRFNLTHSENSKDAKDLILEWAVLPSYQPERLNPETPKDANLAIYPDGLDCAR